MGHVDAFDEVRHDVGPILWFVGGQAGSIHTRDARVLIRPVRTPPKGGLMVASLPPHGSSGCKTGAWPIRTWRGSPVIGAWGSSTVTNPEYLRVIA